MNTELTLNKMSTNKERVEVTQSLIKNSHDMAMCAVDNAKMYARALIEIEGLKKENQELKEQIKYLQTNKGSDIL